MHLSLHPYFGRTIRDGRAKSGELLPHVLRSFVGKFGAGFSIFADCGAGIGETTLEYGEIIPPSGRVFTYEPLPENLRVLEERLQSNERFCLRPVAVSDVNGEAHFSVPTRLQSDMGSWTEGTSYNGYLSESADEFERSLFLQSVSRTKTPSASTLSNSTCRAASVRLFSAWARSLGTLSSSTSSINYWTKGKASRCCGTGASSCFSTDCNLGFQATQFRSARWSNLILPRRAFGPTLATERESVCFGHFSKTAGLIDPDTLALRSEIAEKLREIGAYYVQTDVLAVHPGVASSFVRCRGPLLMP